MLCLLALFTFIGAAQPVESPSAIVVRHWSQYAEWIARRDVEALTDLFAVDARLMEPGIDDIIGRNAIRSLMIYGFAQRVRTVDARMMPREVVGYDGIIYDQGDYIETRAPQNSPKGAIDVYGRYFTVWVQQPDGSWKISRMMRSPKKQPSR